MKINITANNFHTLSLLFLALAMTFNSNAQSANGSDESFITLWDTELESNGDTLTIQVPISGDNYEVYWEFLSDPEINGTLSGLLDPTEIRFPYAGKYRVEVSGLYESILFSRSYQYKDRIYSIEQWGTNQWSSLKSAFRECTNLQVNANDVPDLSQLTSINNMFSECPLVDFDISDWEVGHIEQFNYVFRNASSFNQDVSVWDLSSLVSTTGIFSYSAMDCYNYGRYLEKLTVSNIDILYRTFNAYGLAYLEEHEVFRNYLMDSLHWDIEGDAIKDKCDIIPGDSVNFITIWDTRNSGFSDSNEIVVRMVDLEEINYDIYWESVQDSSVNGTISGIYEITTTIQLPFPGEYRLEFMGSMGFYYTSIRSEKNKLKEILQWGNIPWQSLRNSFEGIGNLIISATDEPNLEYVEDMRNAFAGCSKINMDVSKWDVSNVKLMDGLFKNASSFNQSLVDWDLTSLELAREMLSGSGISCELYSETLRGWANNPETPDDINLGAIGLIFLSDYKEDRNKLRKEKNWTFKGDLERSNCRMTVGDSSNFRTTWRTNLPGYTDNNQILIPVKGRYNFDVYWESAIDSTVNDTIYYITNNSPITFPDTGVYKVEMSGGFTRLKFDGQYSFPIKNDLHKILSVDHWGNVAWTTFLGAFDGCSNLKIKADDTPDLSQVSNFRMAFRDATSLEGGLENWDVSHVKNMEATFMGAKKFNSDISNWQVDSVQNMSYTFAETDSFNADISAWNVGSVENMEAIFLKAFGFNRDIGNWDVSKVTNMTSAFNSLKRFSADISNWDVSNVTDMDFMFAYSNYNGDLSRWNVENVLSMNRMFFRAKEFNSDIGDWNTSACSDFYAMFKSSSVFNADLGSWNISSAEDMRDMFHSARGMTCENYGLTLQGWAEQSNIPEGIVLRNDGALYPAWSESARNFLIEDKNWDISRDQVRPVCQIEPGSEDNFVTIWNTNVDLSGSSFIRFMADLNSDYDIDFDLYYEALHVPNVKDTLYGIKSKGFIQIDFPSPGNYRVEIIGNLPRMSIPFGDKEKLLSIENWGAVRWEVLEFSGSTNLELNATDSPDLRNAEGLDYAFQGASKVNADLSHWDVSQVTSMGSMFKGATLFNGDVSTWDVSQVTSMSGMFEGASSFNQDISSWNVSSVRHFTNLFFGAREFNQDLSSWRLNNLGYSSRLNNNMFYDSGMDCRNYSLTLLGWSENKDISEDVKLNMDSLEYSTEVRTARNRLIRNKGWTFSGDREAGNCDLCKVKTVALPTQPDNCLTPCDGEATAFALSGSEPFSYRWENGSAEKATSELCGGNSSVTVTDSEGCIGVASVSIYSKWDSIHLESQDASCDDCADGVATVLPDGLDYSWESSGTWVNQITGLSPGVYRVTVTNEERCEKTFDIIVGPYDSTKIKFSNAGITDTLTTIERPIVGESSTQNTNFNSELEDKLPGSNDIQKPVFVIYPNPASDFIWVDFYGADESNQLSIYNSVGTLIDAQNLRSSPKRVLVSLLEYPSGLYYIKIGGSVQKFIVY